MHNQGGIEYAGVRALVALTNQQLAEYLWYFFRDNRAGFVKQVNHSKDAINALHTGSYTHFFVGYHLEDIGGAEFSRFIRMSSNDMSRATIMMVISDPDKEKILDARDSGVNEILTLPLSGNQLKKRMLHSTRKPRPFIQSGNYLGPCRRRVVNADYRGSERRISVEYVQKLRQSSLRY